MDAERLPVLLFCLFLLCCGVIHGERLRPFDGEEDASADGNSIKVTVESSHELNDLAANGFLLQQADSVSINIATAQVTLRSTLTLENTAASITGGFDDNSLSEIRCNSKAQSVGFVFLNVKNVTLCNLRITNCGVLYNGPFTTRTIRRFSAAVLVLNSTDTLIDNVQINSSKGTGTIIAYNIRGNSIQIRNSRFTNNQIPNAFQHVLGGGGILVYMKTSLPANITVESCHFELNKARNTPNYSYLYTDELGSPISGTGRGGGLYVNLQGTTSSAVTITDCTFVNNSAFLGAGLSVNINGGDQNSIHIANSSFTQNGCAFGNRSLTASGGGVHLALDTFTNISSTPIASNTNNISVQNVSFNGNCAQNGGGTFLFASRTNLLSESSLLFRNCTWYENSARTGAAVDIEPNTFDRLSSGFFPIPEFVKCRFVSNSFQIRPGSSNGAGTFYSSLFNVIFAETAHFESNSGSALIIVNGVANFSACDAKFINNTGVQGGALALIGNSQILIGAHHKYDFIQNTASDRGGAIYVRQVDYHDFTSSRSCFIQYTDKPGRIPVRPRLHWDAEINFIDNVAKGYGNAIFATSIIPCYVVRNGTEGYYEVLEPEMVFRAQGANFEGAENQIATEGAVFVVTGTEPFMLIPGKQHQLEVSMFDDLGQHIDTSVIASIESAEDIEVDTAFNCISNQTIQLQGRPHQTGSLVLQSTTPRLTSVQLSIELQHCPPGFLLENNECVCNISSLSGFTECNTQNFVAFIIRGFWAGYIRNGKPGNKAELVSSICPLGFCQYNGSEVNNTIALPNNPSEFVCGPNRTGIVCGDCKENHTVYYHTPYFHCKKASLCEAGWLFYIISELVPVTILFIVVIALNITFTSGAVNGFILFSQMLDTLYTDASGVIVHPAAQYPRLVYGFFNLDFFNVDTLSFCIFKNASVLDVLAFKYITVLYSLLLIVAVIVFMRYCGPRCLGKYFRITTLRNSVIHGLSTFIILSYTQCLKVSLGLLTGHVLSTQQLHNSNIPRRVWYNSNIEYFSRQHLPYAIPALFCLVTFGSIPPILLIAYPWSSKVLNALNCNESSMLVKFARRISLSKLKPLLDSFQGCFKDNFRFFAGLYFLYRWMALLVSAVVTYYSTFYVTVEILLIAMLMLHAIVQPYAKRWHNILDALFLANLAFINGFTAAIYFILRVDFGRSIPIDNLLTSQQIFIYIPILYMVGYIAVCTWKKVQHKLKCPNVPAEQVVGYEDDGGNENEAENYNRLEDFEFSSFTDSDRPSIERPDTY